MTDERRFEKVKRNFTEAELLAFKDELARKTREQLEQQADRADTVSKFSASLKAVALEIAQLSDQISTGFEYVEVEMVLLMDQPGPGQKTLVRADTGEEHRVEPMTAEDRQRAFGFEEPKEG